MAKTEMIRARVEPELKSQAEEVFSGLGLSPTEAITLFYRQVTLHHGLPFAVKIPNAETIAALQQARAGEGLTEYANLEDLKGPGTVESMRLLTTAMTVCLFLFSACGDLQRFTTPEFTTPKCGADETLEVVRQVLERDLKVDSGSPY